jgi:acetoin utilization deacetylase AcuC-like enzyme
MVERGGGVLDLENVLSEKSLDAALAAAGAGLDAVEAVWNGEASGAFCAVRPPGHHARPGAVMGFCLLNSAAIAARQAREILGLERVAILDIDVHHGNGIQEIFWRDPSVLYVSLHRYPLWPPGSGTRDETGAGRGLGANLNYPLPPTTGPEAYLRTLDEALDRVLLFKPDVLLVCAGFDTYREDPVVPGGLNLDQEHYGLIGGRIRQAAGEACDGRVVTLLEGGYNIQALPSLVEQYLQGLTGTLGKA